MNVHIPKKNHLRPHDLYGEPPKHRGPTREELERARDRFGPKAIPVDLEKLRKQRRLN